MAGLSVRDVVNVTINLTPTAVPTANFGTDLALGTSNVIDVVQRIRPYTSSSAVAADFGSTAPEYLASVAFFSQSPAPAGPFYVGRWANTNTAGLLHGGSLSAAAQVLSNFTSVTNGTMNITIDGTLVVVSGLNFSSAANLNAVASAVTTALGSHGSCVWGANYTRFDIISASTGTSSSVTFASASGSGTDVSSLMGLQSTQGGYTVAGIAAETVESAVNTLITNSQWYGLGLATTASVSTSDLLSIGQIIESQVAGGVRSRLFVITSNDSNILNAAATTDIAYLAKNAGLSHTVVQYSSTSQYAGFSLFARQAAVDFTQVSSFINLDFQNEPGITAEFLTEAQYAALEAKNAVVFVQFNVNGTNAAYIKNTKVSNGQWIDTIVGCDALASDITTAVFNAIAQAGTRIPQTDAGVTSLTTAVSGVCSQYVRNGFLAPGVWNSAPIGPISTGQTLPLGYVVFSQPISSQTSAQRGTRMAPPITVLVKLAGAIDSSNIVINVNP